MTPQEAHEVLTLLRAATRGQVDEEKAAYFEAALSVLEYAPALNAATIGTITWQYFPSWAEFKEVYRAQLRLQEPDPVIERANVIHAEFKRGVAAPEWVWVWSWARGWSHPARDPVEMRPFPQQQGYVDTAEIMPDSDYEALLAEWVELGSPKAKNPLPA